MLMGHVSREKDKEFLLDERRRLLDYVLEVHKARGGKVQLPIGMNAAEPWLLDAVDVQALVSCLHHTPKATVDLLQYCRKATRTLSSVASRGGRSSDGNSSLTDEAEREAPALQLPQLSTGLSESEIKDLAYLVFASNCNTGVDEELLCTVRSQLDVDESRAAEVARLLELVATTFSRMKEATGSLPVSEQWTANLELPVCLLGVVLPKDFSRFRSFVVWRDTLSHVLLATLAQSVRDGWCQQQSSNVTAQQLMARLKASLRRCDVRDADDFDEEEYRIASRAVGEHTYALVKCTTAGWTFPWGLRVRLCEMLLRGVFDTLDEANYIDGADQYLQLLQTRLWPLLGISPAMHNAGFAWVHFRQFVITRHPGLVAKTKALLKRLAQLARQTSQNGSRNGSSGSTVSAAVAAGGDGSLEDASLTREVGAAVIDWISERLSDYHARLLGVGGPDALPNLVDVLAFAAQSRGASQEEVGDMLAAAVRSSVETELQRRLAAEAGSFLDEADACAAMCTTVQALAREEVETWARGFSGQLPEAAPLALAVLHAAAGSRLLPWLGALDSLDDSTCKALRAAIELEPMLIAPVTAAVAGCQHANTRRTLTLVKSWDTPSQLQPVLGAWVQKQISGFTVWVDRQLQQESWEPLGGQQPHSGSARELRRIVMESLEALFDLGLPLPASIVSMHMEGIDGMLHRYLQGVLDKLGSPAVMMPPLPLLTRYKREVAVKQEEAESGMPGLPEHLPPPGSLSKKGVPFLESVRRIEQEPCFAKVESLSAEVLVVMLASLGYLLDTLQPIANAVADKWHEECRRSSSGGRTTAECSSSGGGSSNPFLSPNRNSLAAGYGAAAGNGYGYSPAADRQQQQQGGWGGDCGGSWGGSWGLSGGGAGQGLGLKVTGGGGYGGSSGRNCNSNGVANSGMRAEELFGSMLEASAQSLRGGVAAVTKWLAVRVVWWAQRACWCELLYRHRVTSCRIDWLLEALGDVLGGAVGLLPRGPRLDVAAALLKEAALALERVLLDGGPCRWFVPADVSHLTEDLEGLRRLFFAEGDGLPMQDVNAALVGLVAVLQLMTKPTGQLVEAHKAARKALLLGGLRNCSTAADGYASPYGGNTGGGAKAQQQQQQQQLGPMASKLKVGAAAAAAAAAAAGPTGSSVYSAQLTGGSSSPRGGANSSKRLGDGWQQQQQQSVMVIVAAGGDVSSQEHVLMQVLCHRPDHAASKYLKEAVKVPKARDETIGEALGRLTRLTRI